MVENAGSISFVGTVEIKSEVGEGREEEL